MRWLLLAPCLIIGLSGCTSPPSAPNPLPVASVPGPSPQPTPPTLPHPPGAAPARVITIGETISDTLTGHGASRLYYITPGEDGKLGLHITWVSRGLIEVWLDDKPIAQEDGGRIRVDWPVRAGQRYRLWVGDGAPWDYDEWGVSYQMTTSLIR